MPACVLRRPPSRCLCLPPAAAHHDVATRKNSIQPLPLGQTNDRARVAHPAASVIWDIQTIFIYLYSLSAPYLVITWSKGQSGQSGPSTVGLPASLSQRSLPPISPGSSDPSCPFIMRRRPHSGYGAILPRSFAGSHRATLAATPRASSRPHFYRCRVRPCVHRS